jgi:hypothetical protein
MLQSFRNVTVHTSSYDAHFVTLYFMHVQEFVTNIESVYLQ